MDRVQVWPMQISHIPEILEIERDVFISPWSEEIFVQELEGMESSRALVATRAGKVVGYAVAWFMRNEAHLVNIAVDRAHRRQGIGSLLLKYMIALARREGKKVLTLEVRESNTSAQAFYRSLFFRQVGLRRGYYSDNREDAILMMLDLGEYGTQKRGKGWGGEKRKA